MENQLLFEIKKILEQIDMRLRAKSVREWLIDYYNSVGKIPSCFNIEE